jgi:predicted SAM-dependent methyltransferase
MEIHPGAVVRLNIGAGSKRHEGWTSVGLDDDHEIRCDVRSIPVPDDYADEAMAIHVIEHIELWDVPAMLKEWLRVLKPGGMLAIECPDLIKSCQNVINDPKDVKNGLRAIYGDITSGNRLMCHAWLPTPAHMRDLLTDAGFIKVKEETPQHHGRRTFRDLRIVARKPHA